MFIDVSHVVITDVTEQQVPSKHLTHTHVMYIVEILKERKFIWHTNEDGHTEKRARSKKVLQIYHI